MYTEAKSKMTEYVTRLKLVWNNYLKCEQVEICWMWRYKDILFGQRRYKDILVFIRIFEGRMGFI